MMATALGGLGQMIGGIIGGTGTVAGYYPANSIVWQQWNAQYATASTNITTQTVWIAWNEQIQSAVSGMVKDETDARSKAKLLLMEHLDPGQKESYEKEGTFIVHGSQGNLYRVSLNRQVRRMREDKEVTTYCIHTYGLPREDELLGFKLLLEADEDEFLKTANATALAA